MGQVGRPKGYAKTGGRQKGSQNKRTVLGGDDMLAKLVEAMEDPERLKRELADLHGKDYFRVYCDLQAYLRPKFSNIEFNGNMSVGNEVTDALRNLIKSNGNEKEI